MLSTSQIGSQGIPTLRSADILVLGGGTAGAAAGIAAAREGLSTLVVEQLGFLGGSQTGALVTPMMPNQLGCSPLNAGLDLEINLRLNASGGSGVWKDGNRGWFDPEALKRTLEALSLEAGAELLYFTFFEDVIADDGVVKGVVAANKAGRSAIFARRTIDCTGDADAAFRAGVPCESGEAGSGKNQPFSARFHLGNIDLKRFGDFLRSFGPCDVLDPAEGSDVPLVHTAMVWGKGWALEPLFRRAVEEGALKESDGDYFQAFSMAGRPGEMSFNCPRIADDTDGTDPFHLTRAAVKGREIALRYADFCKRYLPGFERSYLVLTAPLIGVRESRRIRGEYRLTAEDVLGGKKFGDAVCRNCYPLDIHRAKEEAGRINLKPLPPGEYHEVPYRALVPLKAENLLVAGRCISASFEAQSSIRVQSNCRALGEAAGLAAALSIKQGITPRALDGARLRAELKARGANL
ncbi:MAG: FAD-dependent oxidoreductase [Elusimicrobiota bacterium]